MRVSSALIFVLCLLVPVSLWGGELYNWTDENGVQHFSNIRPSGIQNIRVIQGVPESSGPHPPPVTPTAGDTQADKTSPSQSPGKKQPSAKSDTQKRTADIDAYLGPCYVRFLKRKTPNGAMITTNANWVYQIGEPLRTLVGKQWQVGDQLKICREKGFIFNLTRDKSAAIRAVRIRKGKS